MMVEIVKRSQSLERPVKYKVRLIGLGNALFWAFIGFIYGYLLAALVAAPIWNR